MNKLLFTLIFMAACSLRPASAQESPFFVTYNHHMEEPGNLDVEASTTSGVPRSGQAAYTAPYMELEYGVTAQWTSEFYLEGQSTMGDSTVFTGWRLENRYKVLSREHWVNPVLYAEYESVNEASRILKEIEGGGPDLTSRNARLPERDHELETKLILSSDYRDWNIAENFIAAKNFSQKEGVEFGYSFGISRPLATLASGSECRLCRENFIAGIEIYGGLGNTLNGFGVRDTQHYIAPVISWLVSENSTLKFSPGLGLNQQSNPVLIRFGYTYEFQGVGGKVAKLFGKKQ